MLWMSARDIRKRDKENFVMQRFIKVLPDLTALLVSLGAAWLLKWKTEDLVWNLWLASLVIGYATMISLILASHKAANNFHDPSDIWGHRKNTLSGEMRFGPYLMFAFFCFHSSAFYAMHVAFISSGFENPDVNPKEFWDSIGNPFRLWGLIFEQILPVYFWMLLPILVSERGSLRRTYQKQHAAFIKISEGSESNNTMGVFMLKPYLNIMKLQFLIFWLLSFDNAERQQTWIYTLLFILYFFPWRALFGKSDQVELNT